MLQVTTVKQVFTTYEIDIDNIKKELLSKICIDNLDNLDLNVIRMLNPESITEVEKEELKEEVQSIVKI